MEGPSTQNGGILLDARCESAVKEGLPSTGLHQHLPVDRRQCHLPCRFGGSRPFFICPGLRNGADCGRRVAKLHFVRRFFLCRHCNQLAYASQVEQPWKRAIRRVNKLKNRLGIDVRIAEPLPDKPKGMWVRTYGCLLDEILRFEELANEAQAKRFKRLLAQLKND
jgi:hypothetical protein